MTRPRAHPPRSGSYSASRSDMRQSARIAAYGLLRKLSRIPDSRLCGSTTWVRVILARSIRKQINLKFGRKMSSRRQQSSDVHLGVTQICFLGIRLGALLAMLAAAQCRTNSSLALISPILSGRRYLRELRTIRMAASAGQTHVDVAPNERNAGAMEISGFTFSAATLASLGKIDFTEPSTPPALDMLIIDGATMPVATQWAQRVCAISARATISFLARIGRDGDDRTPICSHPPGDDRGDA